MSDTARPAPAVSGSQVIAAGFAATVAAFVTSRFGVTGTLLGAGITAMIITGGSALLKAYFESVTGRVRKVPDRVRERRDRRKADRYADQEPLPERPDLRDNFVGRLRAALGWFSHLPPLARRSILVRGLIAAVVAFVIGMGAVFAVEKGIGNSLSCGLWAKCPEGATPGIHLGGGDGSGASSSLLGGRARTQAGPDFQRGGAPQDGVQQQNGSYQQGDPGSQQGVPGDPGARPGGILNPDRPAEPEPEAPVRPEKPASPSPAPESPPPEEEEPEGASPAPAQ